MIKKKMLPVAAAFAVCAFTGAALAQGAGKVPTMIIGFGPGGGYDLWGRVVARHIGKFLPGNHNLITQNMPGAGSYVAASWIYNIAPKDGSVMGIIARDATMGPLTGADGARFDATKMSWLGTPTTETWFWEHRVPAGQKAYSMTKPIRQEHLADCAAWWGGPSRQGREEGPQAWRVTAEEIKARGYNLDIKNPHAVALDHGDPETLAAELDAAEAETARLRDQLKAILAEALAR